MSSSNAAAFLGRMGAAAFGTVGEWLQIGIADRTTDQLIGDIGICIRGSGEKHAELGFTLAAEWHGRGLGSEAVLEAVAMLLDRTDIARVVSITDTRNHASISLLLRVGMKLTETMNSVFRGEPCTEHVFTVGRHDTPTRRANPSDEPAGTAQPSTGG
jgi:RimJ/RimL family protein N-acetyltransferase